jgi:hypothetical protein
MREAAYGAPEWVMDQAPDEQTVRDCAENVIRTVLMPAPRATPRTARRLDHGDGADDPVRETSGALGEIRQVVRTRLRDFYAALEHAHVPESQE